MRGGALLSSGTPTEYRVGVSAATPKFEVKRLGILGHHNDCMGMPRSGYFASNFAGAAYLLLGSCREGTLPSVTKRMRHFMPHPQHSEVELFCVWSVVMKKQTLDKLEAAFEAVERDLSGRVAELAVKSTDGKLSQEEQSEYEHIVRLNELLSLLKLQTEEYWSPRVAS